VFSPSLPEVGIDFVPFASFDRSFRALVRFARSDAHDLARKMNLKNR
jgi:hypothetical protein